MVRALVVFAVLLALCFQLGTPAPEPGNRASAMAGSAMQMGKASAKFRKDITYEAATRVAAAPWYRQVLMLAQRL